MTTYSQRHYETHQTQPPHNEMRLTAGIPLELDPSLPLAERSDHNILARISAGEQEFLVIDSGKSKIDSHRPGYMPFGKDIIYGERFMIVNYKFNPSDLLSRGFKEFGEKELVVGRVHHSSTFGYESDFDLSRQHFSLKYEGNKVIITDLESFTGTAVLSHTEQVADSTKSWPNESDEQHAPSQPVSHLSRSEQLNRLPNSIREDVERVETTYPDLDIYEIASLIFSIHSSRYNNLSDKKIYATLAKNLHPDSTEGLDQKDHSKRETSFKLLNSLFDQSSKSFKI